MAHMAAQEDPTAWGAALANVAMFGVVHLPAGLGGQSLPSWAFSNVDAGL